MSYYQSINMNRQFPLSIVALEVPPVARRGISWALFSFPFDRYNKMKASLALILAVATTALAGPNCPPQGPVYEKRYDFRDSDSMQAAIANLTATFTAWDQNNSSAIRANTTSYSIEVFSTSEENPLLFSWHHTAASLAEATKNTSGVRETGPDAVYRLGSLTKVFTVYTWLVQDGDVKWNEPITKYVPELAVAADLAKDDPVEHVAWDEVTIGALAGQLSGAIRDCELIFLDENQKVKLRRRS